MTSGGSGAWRSRGRREAMPKPVSRARPSAQFTRILAGLTSLWTRPRWCALPSAAAMPMARRRKRPDLHRRADEPLERLAARILEQQRRPTAFAGKLQRPRRPCAVELVLQFIFVGEAFEAGAGAGAPRRAARPARRCGRRRRPRAIPGRRRVRHPPTGPGGRLFPERRTETIAPIAMLRRASCPFAVSPDSTNSAMSSRLPATAATERAELRVCS